MANAGSVADAIVLSVNGQTVGIFENYRGYRIEAPIKINEDDWIEVRFVSDFSPRMEYKAPFPLLVDSVDELVYLCLKLLSTWPKHVRFPKD